MIKISGNRSIAKSFFLIEKSVAKTNAKKVNKDFHPTQSHVISAEKNPPTTGIIIFMPEREAGIPVEFNKIVTIFAKNSCRPYIVKPVSIMI